MATIADNEYLHVDMDLSLSDAARVLGKTPRQVRYMLKKGELKGKKNDGGHWRIDSDDLPLTAEQVAARHRKLTALEDSVRQALGPHLEPRRKQGYSIRETAAFTAGAPLYQSARDALGDAHDATVALRQSLVSLSRGVHRFHAREKYDAYWDARERGAEAAALVLLEDKHADLADQIERNLLPAITGLVRRYERR